MPAGDQLDRPRPGFEKAKPGWLLPYFRFAKALAEYRAGRLETALTLLDGDTLQVLGPAPRLLLAMVQHRLGKADAPGASFRAAVADYVWDAKRATDREAWMFHLLQPRPKPCWRPSRSRFGTEPDRFGRALLCTRRSARAGATSADDTDAQRRWL